MLFIQLSSNGYGFGLSNELPFIIIAQGAQVTVQNQRSVKNSFLVLYQAHFLKCKSLAWFQGLAGLKIWLGLGATLNSNNLLTERQTDLKSQIAIQKEKKDALHFYSPSKFFTSPVIQIGKLTVIFETLLDSIIFELLCLI